MDALHIALLIGLFVMGVMAIYYEDKLTKLKVKHNRLWDDYHTVVKELNKYPTPPPLVAQADPEFERLLAEADDAWDGYHRSLEEQP